VLGQWWGLALDYFCWRWWRDGSLHAGLLWKRIGLRGKLLLLFKFAFEFYFILILTDCGFYRAQILGQDMANQSATSTKPSAKATRHTSPPFIPAHDLTRGLLHIVQVTLGFLFMLTVM
jgi:hypothetical protein